MKGYNLRVYGLLFNEGQVLVTYENRAEMIMTKFPGGGLEFGEGLADCLIREFMEELQLNIKVKELIYVNDFLQISAFNNQDQLISFYYRVETDDVACIPINDYSFELAKNQQLFNWHRLDALDVADFTFPIDKKVVELLIG